MLSFSFLAIITIVTYLYMPTGFKEDGLAVAGEEQRQSYYQAKPLCT